MKNVMQLKAIIRNLSKENQISAQIIMQNYMLERFLERISVSEYKFNFILKGGFLIAAIVGINTRATIDMDGTLKGMPVNAETINNMFIQICQINLDDAITFSIRNTEEIRENDKYFGLRVTLNAELPPMTISLKIDLTSGDKITPQEIIYDYKLLLEPRTIQIMAYNTETILAEKIETVITRGDLNTRSRDYYDIFIIHKLQWNNVNIYNLREALIATANKRDSLSQVEKYHDIINVITNSRVLNEYWENYQRQFDYAKEIKFSEVCQVIIDICNEIFNSNQTEQH